MNTEIWLWKIGIIIMSISFVSAAFVLVYFLKKRKPIQNRDITTNIQEDKKSNYALKRWRFFFPTRRSSDLKNISQMPYFLSFR